MLLVTATVLAACSARPSDGGGAAPADATTPTPPPDAPPDAAPADPTLSISRSATTMAKPRDHHTTFVVESGGGASVWVIGGTNAWTTIYDDVLRAPIHDDGSLGAFEQVGTLPAARAGHTAVLLGSELVVSGGHTMDASGAMSTLDSTITATIAADGTLGPWRSGPSLPMPVMHHTCNAIDRTITCVGGRIDGNFTGTMAVRATASDDGTLNAWTPITPLTQSIGFHQAFVHERALYVAGGLHRDAPMSDFDRLKTIMRLRFADDGTPGAWETVGELPSARYASAAQVFGDQVYFAGGQDENDDPVATVVAARLGADGTVSGARVLGAKLSVARMHVHQTPVHGNWLYSIGGRDAADRSLTAVDLGHFQ
jgi:hypothetical protein